MNASSKTGGWCGLLAVLALLALPALQLAHLLLCHAHPHASHACAHHDANDTHPHVTAMPAAHCADDPGLTAGHTHACALCADYTVLAGAAVVLLPAPAGLTLAHSAACLTPAARVANPRPATAVRPRAPPCAVANAYAVRSATLRLYADRSAAGCTPKETHS